MVDREISSADFARMRAAANGAPAAGGGAWAQVTPAQRLASRHSSTYNSRLCLYYWEAFGFHPAFPDQLRHPLVYTSIMAPIESFGRCREADALPPDEAGPGPAGGAAASAAAADAAAPAADSDSLLSTPDVEAYRLTHARDLRLTKQEVDFLAPKP